MRVLVLHDVSPGETRFGVRRRLEHLRYHDEVAGNAVEVRSIVPDSRPSPSHVERFIRALIAGRLRTVAGFDKVVVVALAAPHMVLLARSLTRRGIVPVQLDVCDSRLLMASERRRAWRGSARLRAAASEVVAKVAFSRLPPELTRSYISQQDIDADAGLSASRTLVVSPSPIPDLAALGPFVGRPQSILFPVDGTSVEGRAAIALLLEVLSEAGIDVPIEISAPAPADEPTAGPSLRWLGHVPELQELYSRPCVVVSTQPADHGIQNKLWEAFQARRPIVAFDAALHWAPRLPWIHRVHSRGDFGPVLRAALEREYDTGAGAALPLSRPG